VLQALESFLLFVLAVEAILSSNCLLQARSDHQTGTSMYDVILLLQERIHMHLEVIQTLLHTTV
jgi:hypothetical protein